MAQGKTGSARPGSARAGAVALLNAVLGEGRLLAQALDEPGFAGLSPADRARAQRLATETLRAIEPADKVLKPLLRKAPPLPVLNILRLAVVELAGGAAPHGVVNEAVGLARSSRKTGHLSGLVNAVLRQLPEELALTPVQKMPRWLRQPLVHAYGREIVTAIEAVQAMAPPLDLTLRTGAEPPEGEALPTGSLRLADRAQVSTLPGYEAGGWWVQDAAAALAVPLLGKVQGLRVLDLCAAPGGKTLQLAAAGAQVTALDISGPRMTRVQENLGRTGLAADCVVADALQWAPATPFDAIVLDAPCSATGTIRRHPDLPFVKDGSEIAGLVELQAKLLDRALGWLRPGGRLVYCTCSLLPEEGEAQLAAALARNPGLRVIAPTVQGLDPAWITSEGGLRLRPDHWAEKGGMDGFFMACLQVG
ncbi:RsmB/NOP family class I SAM-dependent RNA methyltransferase [Tabrizicola oligotrophica]|uniref:Methyltransferase domain-containing protein n=1 Tax=Tabrizicola oligotrophica TaxID=2710650 RepID=A0A6M0QU39_9RHOB|nr:transcription antitermination factor NusB [Tabrizicola oligotrophica]NEY89972.1 methyltransferase domain-containing protein [Tabrizicola oligotrophica]